MPPKIIVWKDDRNTGALRSTTILKQMNEAYKNCSSNTRPTECTGVKRPRPEPGTFKDISSSENDCDSSMYSDCSEVEYISSSDEEPEPKQQPIARNPTITHMSSECLQCLNRGEERTSKKSGPPLMTEWPKAPWPPNGSPSGVNTDDLSLPIGNSNKYGSLSHFDASSFSMASRERTRRDRFGNGTPTYTPFPTRNYDGSTDTPDNRSL